MAEIDEGLPRSGPDVGIRSIMTPEKRKVTSNDPVSRVLKWVLLGTAIICFASIAWATQLTYRDAPMQPDRFVVQYGTVVMSGDDTAENLVALATVTRENLAQAGAGRSFASIEVA